jgi:aminoglycoside phosphotransferase
VLAASRIPLDPQVPQLAQLVDEAAMQRVFAPFAAAGWMLRRCRIKEVRYYPAFTCLLTYHLKFSDPQGESTTLLLHGRAFGATPVPECFRDGPALATPAATVPRCFDDLGLALWTFPDDPGVPGLGRVWRSGGALFDQPGVLVHRPWLGERPRFETLLVSYVASKRCILRYESMDHARPESFYGKVYGQDDARVLFAQMQALWDWSQSHAPELRLAQPLGCDPATNALWQSSPGGEPLLEVLAERDAAALLRRVAAAMAALHRCPLRPERRWRIEDEVAKLRRAQAALSRFHPERAAQVDRLLGDLLDCAPGEPEHLVPVHGDFHCNQVLVHEDRVAVIDFDLFGMGDPLLDVARFLSRFRAHVSDKLGEADTLQAQRAFLSAYEILVPWRVDRRRLGWILAALLVNRQALKSVKKLSAGGSEPVATLLETAARMAGGAE